MIYDLIILGAGPAGLTAAIYARRARLSFIVIEKESMGGGQIVNTEAVENYPGLPGISGFELAEKFEEHAKKLGAVLVTDTVTGLEEAGEKIKTVICRRGTYETRSVILAAGAVHRKLGIPGEEKFYGRGVSACAVCDGAFYRDAVTAVVGGGDAAVEDALFLSRLCRKVYLIHRRDQLRAAASLQEEVRARGNVEILWNTVVKEICGDREVEAIRLEKAGSGESRLPVDGVFPAVGMLPNTAMLGGTLLNEEGYVVADESGQTSLPGIFAAGDIRAKPLRQIVTAVADGANAATAAEKYLSRWGTRD